MSLLTELQTLKNKPEIYGADGPLGLCSESLRHTKSVVETLADMASYTLSPAADEKEAEGRQRMRHLLLDQEIDVTIHAYPVFRTPQTEEEEKQGIRGKIWLVHRDEEDRETRRVLWKLIVDFQPEDD